MSNYKNPAVKGRKFHGSPHLKIKMVKQSLRQKIWQLLRSFIPLEQFRIDRETDRIQQ